MRGDIDKYYDAQRLEVFAAWLITKGVSRQQDMWALTPFEKWLTTNQLIDMYLKEKGISGGR